MQIANLAMGTPDQEVHEKQTQRESMNVNKLENQMEH
jgi:hypothetical protein